jgi:hypothetical protein
MTSKMNKSSRFSPELLSAIDQAFKAVWRTLYANVRPDDKTQTRELSILLSQTLASLASEGIADAKELGRKALEKMALHNF